MSFIRRINRHSKLLIALLLVFALLATAYPYNQAPLSRRGEAEEPFNQLNAALFERARIVKFSSEQVPKDAFSQPPFREKPIEDAGEERPPEKIHPLLKEWVLRRGAQETELIMINFRDRLKIPRFPEPSLDEPRDSAANRRALARAEQLVKNLETSRADDHQKMAQELGERYRAKVVDTFWLVNAMVVEMPLGAVYELAQREDVLYLEPQDAGEKPPQNGNPNDDVADGRGLMVTDPYFNLGLTGGYIGLLDTGLRFSHTQFNSPSHIAFRFDCVNGGGNCILSGAGYNPNDDCWNHGTSTAAIITANANQGTAFRGVTGVTLDSFKVYPNSCGGLNGTAVVKAFEKAVAVLDRVIVAEMQGSGSDTSTISTAADNAFDAGAVVIAANGNNGPAASTVNTPANAHKAIGVGAIDVQTQAQQSYQSRGPAPDNRYKPDLQAPTNAETASNASDTAFQNFGGTSGATPFAAGAATLLRNWLRGTSFSIDPGQVYAQLILSGQQPYPFNNTSGAGPLRLPTDGWAWWGKVTITNGLVCDLPLNISGGSPNTFDGALWWPETPAQSHNDIDLSLVDPSGVVRASSISIPSIFERARVYGSVTPGTWKVRIRGYNVPTGSQTVYWAAHVRLS